MSKRIGFALAILAAACTDEPPGAASQTAALTLVLPGVPAGINCVDVSFRDQDDVTVQRQAHVPPRRVTFDGVHLGAYEVGARAYSAADCALVPDDAPWGTAATRVLIVTASGPNEVFLELEPTRPVDVVARFVETEVVVAQNQGPLGTIAAAGNHLAWIVPETTAPGRLVSFFDDEDSTGTPLAVVTDAVRPADLATTTDGRIFWIQQALRLQPTTGAVWRYTPTFGPDVAAAGQHPLEITYAADTDAIYWSDNDQIQVVNGSGPPGPFVLSVEPGANNITVLRGATPSYEILWGRYDDGVVRRYPKFNPVSDAASSGLLPPTHGIIGSAADDTAAYVSTYDENDEQGYIYRVATDGSNSVIPLTARGPIKWPVEVADGWVYYGGGGELRRVPADGSGPEERLAISAGGGFALTSWGGRNWIYWTDNRFGGVVWRGRLQ